MSAKTVIFYYWKTFTWLLVMFYVLFSPSNKIPQSKLFNLPHFDKIVHFGIFAVLLWIFLTESEKQLGTGIKNTYKILIAFILFAAVSEVIQYYYIVGRSGSIYDFLADITGFISGSIFYYFIWKNLINMVSRKK
jgi:VanZ family protein